MRKIMAACIEGRLLTKMLAFLKRLSKLIISRIDYLFGLIVRLIYRLFVKRDPNKIMFITSSGDYTCNPKYITEQLIAEGANVNLIWSSRKTAVKEGQFPEQVTVVDKQTYPYFKELYSASIIVTNALAIFKRPYPGFRGQILIQTWHGSLGIKKIEHKGPRWLKKMQKMSATTSYLISNSDFEDNVYRNSYWPKGEILQLGHARNDILHHVNEEQHRVLKEKIFDRYNIDGNPNIILYAPTYREDHSLESYDLSLELVVEAAKQRFGGDWVVLTRYHAFIRQKIARMKKSQETIDVSSYPDMQELLTIADIGITDYSSWIFDYMFTKKPAFIYASDIERYNDTRGFYYRLEETPFPIATTNEALRKHILAFEPTSYNEKTIKFIESKGCMEDGKASERIVKKIHELME